MSYPFYKRDIYYNKVKLTCESLTLILAFLFKASSALSTCPSEAASNKISF